jgi:dienelactone hydrolase
MPLWEHKLEVNIAELSGLDEWLKMRQAIESKVKTYLGKMPKDPTELQTKVIDEFDHPGYVRKRINYFVDEWTRVSAWLFEPDEMDDKPAIICCHSRNRIGKDEPAGANEGDPALAFAKHYAEMGYVTLAPDCLTAGERIYSKSEAFETKTFYKENPKWSLLGKMLFDHIRAVDVLSDFKGVDPFRIGVLGHGLGGTNAMLLGAFDERIRAVVASCAFTLLETDENPSRWVEDEGCVLIPKLKKDVADGKFGFDWDQILAMIAPNPTLIISASNDEVLGSSKSCEQAVKNAQVVYGKLGAKMAMESFSHKDGHTVTWESQVAADEWMDRWL